jgi:hypothetical protein
LGESPARFVLFQDHPFDVRLPRTLIPGLDPE